MHINSIITTILLLAFEAPVLWTMAFEATVAWAIPLQAPGFVVFAFPPPPLWGRLLLCWVIGFLSQP